MAEDSTARQKIMRLGKKVAFLEGVVKGLAKKKERSWAECRRRLNIRLKGRCFTQGEKDLIDEIFEVCNAD